MTFETFWDEDYLVLEEEFLNFIKYVPLVENHINVWSMKLANLLLLVGSSIDSFLKNSLQYCLTLLVEENCQEDNNNPQKLSEYADYQQKLDSDNTNMGIFRDVFNEFYNLSDEPVYVLSNKWDLKPFAAWSEDKSPDWWDVYRKLKHNRIENRDKCTLIITLNALSALFLLNVYHIESRKKLIDQRKDVIRSNLNLRGITDFTSNKGEIHVINPIIAKSELFGYVFNTESLYYSNPWTILDPGNPHNVFHL